MKGPAPIKNNFSNSTAANVSKSVVDLVRGNSSPLQSDVVKAPAVVTIQPDQEVYFAPRNGDNILHAQDDSNHSFNFPPMPVPVPVPDMPKKNPKINYYDLPPIPNQDNSNDSFNFPPMPVPVPVPAMPKQDPKINYYDLPPMPDQVPPMPPEVPPMPGFDLTADPNMKYYFGAGALLLLILLTTTKCLAQLMLIIVVEWLVFLLLFLFFVLFLLLLIIIMHFYSNVFYKLNNLLNSLFL